MSTVKIVLGKRPESIHRIVKVPLPEGKTGTIEVDFKYRTRREFAKFVDEMVEGTKAQAQAQAEAAEAAEEKFSTHSITDATVRANAKYLGDAIVGWNLDAELCEESLVQLCDELPGVCQALMDAYRAAITEGRSGN